MQIPLTEIDIQEMNDILNTINYLPLNEDFQQFIIECLHRGQTWNIDILALLSNVLIADKFLSVP